jgi:hypothetical protein
LACVNNVTLALFGSEWYVGRRRCEKVLIHDLTGFYANPPALAAYHTVKPGMQKEIAAPERIQKKFYPTMIFIKPLPKSSSTTAQLC